MQRHFIRAASLDDVTNVAGRLRNEDRDEIIAAVGIPPLLALPPYVAEGREVWCAGLVEDGIPEVLWGFDPIAYVDRAAVCWLVSTPRIYEHPQVFAPATKIGFEEAHQRFDLLTNFIDARNTRHIKWLQWLGFTLIRRVDKFGAQSLPFIEFASYRPCA